MTANDPVDWLTAAQKRLQLTPEQGEIPHLPSDSFRNSNPLKRMIPTMISPTNAFAPLVDGPGLKIND